MKYLIVASLLSISPFSMAQETEEPGEDLAPKVKITRPARGVLAVGTTVDVEATPVRLAQAIAIVRIYQNKNLLCEVTAAPYVCPGAVIAQGPNRFQAVACDANNECSNSGAVVVKGQ